MRSPVAHLPEATLFSDEAEFFSPLTLISMVKGMAPLWRRLRAETRIDHGYPRGPGDWALVFLAFTISGHVNIATWFKRTARHDAALWAACGFSAMPDYPFIHERLTELETKAKAFERAAAEIIQHARRIDPRVGAHWHVDGTEAATHASPRHDCRPGEPCATAGERKRRLRLMGTDEATTLRQDASEQPADGSRLDDEAVSPLKVDRVIKDKRGGVRFYCGGHWWYSRDRSAGTRAYRAGRNGRTLRAWHGFYHQHVVDHFTGGILATHVHAADVSEWVAYPAVYERACANVGAAPLVVAMDRGYALDPVYEFHTRRGVATVSPYRRRNQSDPEKAVGTDDYDEHGVPRCRHCGGGSDFVRFEHAPRPRITFRCALPQTPECRKDQTISCSRSWRRLVPLWRTTEAYGAMRHAQDNKESAHQAMRERYRSGGKTTADRPRRIGAAWQQLRASAGLLIEWLWICRRQGWLGSSGRNAEPVLSSDGGIPRKIFARRNRLGLVGGSVPISVMAGLSPPRPAPPPGLPPPAPPPVAPGAPLPF